MKILISGASGFIGSSLVSFFKKNNHDVYALVRSKGKHSPKEIEWDLSQGIINPVELEGFDAVIHLAGENITGRWNKKKKKAIKESRVKGAQLLCEALSKLKAPPSVFIGASAIGYYGNRSNEILDELSSQGSGFLASVCGEVEKATHLAAINGIRVVNLRIGMVLSATGGALKRILPIFKWGLGGEIGTGNQFVSWIALNDLIRVIDYAINETRLFGPVNGVAPLPVTNREMTKSLGSILCRPTFFRIPSWLIRLLFGEFGEEVLLSSARVMPFKLTKMGFQFDFPRLDEALKKL